MIDAESIVTGLRISSSILLILSFLNTKSSVSLRRGTWMSLFSVLTGVIASNPSEYIYLLPSLGAGLAVGFVLARFVSIKTLPAYLSFGFFMISLFVTYTYVLAFEIGLEYNVFTRVLFTFGSFLACQSCAGSLIAFGKVTHSISSKQFYVLGWFRHVTNLILFLAVVSVLVLIEVEVLSNRLFLVISLGLSGLFGLHTNLAVGFCDVSLMLPLMSSYMGFAVAAMGLLVHDYLLIVAGSLLGASSLILGFHFAKVINRNIVSVILASFSQTPAEEVVYPSSKSYETVSSQELIKQVKISTNILVIPGYGVVKAGCEGKIVEFFNILQGTGKNITMCIHPAAGRMPGHLNLVFESAGLNSKFLRSVEETNAKMKETDLVITIGANDIINPGAYDFSTSALGGFPVVRVWESKSSVILLPKPDSLGFCKQNLTLCEKPKVKFMYADANVLLIGMLREAKSRRHSLIRYNPSDKNLDTSEVVELMDFPRAFMSVGVPKETTYNEKRVALTPAMVSKFRMLGFRVQVETGAGRAADFLDDDYELKGAEIVEQEDVWDNDIILKIQKPNDSETEMLTSVKLVVSYVYPSKCNQFLDRLSKRFPRLTYIAMDLVPKSNKGQSVDSVKLMQTIEGYRAVIEAFRVFARFPKPMITAAGKLPPAQVLVIGTDVAGISAVSYLKSLGCVTRALDTRNTHKDEVEQLHAQLIAPRQAIEGEDPKKLFYEAMKASVKSSDVVICSGLLHSYEKILDESVLLEMKPGSIVVDINGNMCTKVVRDNEVVLKNGVRVMHFSDLVSRMSPQASELYASCLYNIFIEIYNGESLALNEVDDLVGSMLVIKEGRMLWYSRAPPSPITSHVHTGKIAYRLLIPAAEDTSESVWSKLEFLWTFAVVSVVVISFSFACSVYYNWESIMEDLFVLVLALNIGWVIFSSTSIVFFANLVARAAGVTGIALVVGFRFWNDLDYLGIGVASGVTFLFSVSFSFIFGIAFKTCVGSQDKLTQKFD